MQSQGPPPSPPKDCLFDDSNGDTITAQSTYDSVISLLPCPEVRSCALIGCLTQSQDGASYLPTPTQWRAECGVPCIPLPLESPRGPFISLRMLYTLPLSLNLTIFPSPLPRGLEPPRRGDVR